MADTIDIKDKLVTNEDLKAAMQFIGGSSNPDIFYCTNSTTWQEVTDAINDGQLPVYVETGANNLVNYSTYQGHLPVPTLVHLFATTLGDRIVINSLTTGNAWTTSINKLSLTELEITTCFTEVFG